MTFQVHCQTVNIKCQAFPLKNDIKKKNEVLTTAVVAGILRINTSE